MKELNRKEYMLAIIGGKCHCCCPPPITILSSGKTLRETNSPDRYMGLVESLYICKTICVRLYDNNIGGYCKEEKVSSMFSPGKAPFPLPPLPDKQS